MPFVFVLTSDTPLDLSAFGSGRTWSHDAPVGDGPASAIQARSEAKSSPQQ